MNKAFCLAGILIPFCGFSADIFSPVPAPQDAVAESPFFSRTLPGSSRWQQVYGSTDFTSISNGGGFVTAISFDSGGAPYGSTLPDVEIRLSTTTRAPDSLSPVFAENVGLGETLVLDGPMRIGQNTGGGYVFRIDLTTPYYYNPAVGNLLVDIKNYVTYPQTPFPPNYGIYVSISPTDRVSAVNSSDVNSSQGSASTVGLLTMFTVTPVPEPSTIGLAGLGLALMLAFRSQARKH